MAAKAKLHGRPLQTAKKIEKMYAKPRDPSESRRAWGKRLSVLVHELATQCNVDPRHFVGYVPLRIVEAIERERMNAKLAYCDVQPAVRSGRKRALPTAA